ncbi:hypothetical protein CANCADRAFT_93770 [Tortispora caseinolytica NRRL Y-17796]|uniref:Het-C-domain-containing protein n=1 Tax=Tortispora caseinolytica NRRL Y-17796 TaxID=767744 RepID=A0A1E4TM69_9ASCO|nr:hypothetical protein CANCADRAFT_93770 [Tortispora caseinolytica NRRL Y-17796]
MFEPVLILAFWATGAAAFGAGSVPSVSKVAGINFRHGDIENALANIVLENGHNFISRFLGRKDFDRTTISRIYFGNWLRDYSQAVDIGTLSKGVTLDTIRVLVWVLSFLNFGYATEEFKLTNERLGCYRPEEHIDNPRGYGAEEGDPRQFDARLRPPVEDIELEVDPETGMKNYIANEKGGWATSSAYVGNSLYKCIELARKSHQTGDDADMYEAYRLLGQSLHTLEDFAAHSNYLELTLIEMGHKNVFPHVGSNCKISLNGKKVYPIVTGTFGGMDFIHSLFGEAEDKITQSEVKTLQDTMGNANDNQSSLSTNLMDQLNKLPFSSISNPLDSVSNTLSGSLHDIIPDSISDVIPTPWSGSDNNENSGKDEKHGFLGSILRKATGLTEEDSLLDIAGNLVGSGSSNKINSSLLSLDSITSKFDRMNLGQFSGSSRVVEETEDVSLSRGADTASSSVSRTVQPDSCASRAEMAANAEANGFTMTSIQAQMQSLEADSAEAHESGQSMTPNEIAARLYPFLKFRDSIVRGISTFFSSIPGFDAFMESITDTITLYIMGLISPFIMPLLNTLVKSLGTGTRMIVNGEDQYRVWNDPDFDDPTHSQLSKDHFSLYLNEPAGLVSQYVVCEVVKQVAMANKNEHRNETRSSNENNTETCQDSSGHKASNDQKNNKKNPQGKKDRIPQLRGTGEGYYTGTSDVQIQSVHPAAELRPLSGSHVSQSYGGEESIHPAAELKPYPESGVSDAPPTAGTSHGYGAQGYASQQYGSAQGYPPQGYPLQVYPLQAYPPQAYPPQAYPPQAYPPQAYPPQAYPPQGYPSQGNDSSNGYPPPGYGGQRY